MTARLLLVAALSIALPVAGQQRLVRAMAVDPDAAIRLWLPAGFVEVQGWDRDSVDVRATPAPGTSLVGGGSRSAAKFSLETNRGDSVLASASVRVMVPRRARLWIKATTATVNVQGVRGELDLLQVSGGTSISDGQGVVRVESITGAITLMRVSGAMVIRGGSGRMRLSSVAGTLEATSVSGAVWLSDASQPLEGNIETVGGEAQVLGRLHAETRLSVATHDGPITIIPFGAPLPKVEGTVPGSTIPPGVRDASGAGGIITVRSFKGVLNVANTGGI